MPDASPTKPVSPALALVTRPEVRRDESDGVALLVDTRSGTEHRLSAEAAEIWDRLDGRPLGRTLGDPLPVAARELVRQLRALDLVIESPG